jgi:hypothetical protein
MARLTISQKATRVLGFLLGLRSARIAAWLKPYGFDQTALQEGWALLRAVGKTQLDSDPEQPSYDPDTLDVLDRWENKWFTIADATLVRHAPDVHRWFFKNLSQTDGACRTWRRTPSSWSRPKRRCGPGTWNGAGSPAR